MKQITSLKKKCYRCKFIKQYIEYTAKETRKKRSMCKRCRSIELNKPIL